MDMVESLFQQKLTRYEQLAAVLKEEKVQIVNADLTELWRISEKKQSLANEIEEIRVRILDNMTAMSIEHGMTPRSFRTDRLISFLPKEQHRRLAGIQSSLLSSKDEIRSICMENEQYIKTKLGMIDELISIITGQEHSRQGQGYYGTARKRPGTDAPMLFRREA